MPKPIEIILLCPNETFEGLYFHGNESLSLGDFFQQVPALSLIPIPPAWMAQPRKQFTLIPKSQSWDKPLYCPPGLQMVMAPPPVDHEETKIPPGDSPAETSHPDLLEERHAVFRAYSEAIDKAAAFLRSGLSVLVMCDKLIAPHLYPWITSHAQLDALVLEVRADAGADSPLMPQSLRQRQLAELKRLVAHIKHKQVLVLPHLDLLAGGGGSNPSNEAREVTEILYEAKNCLLLAMVDRSLDLPEVLSARFSVRFMVSGVPRKVTLEDGTPNIPLAQALITRQEMARMPGFDAVEFYKNVAGMNPLRLRHAITYALREESDSEGMLPAKDLYRALRAFKAQTSAKFEVPRVTLEDIGGYEDVKQEISRALELINHAFKLPDESLRQELIPRGFIFHGPPGTGKTLFAKAIANVINATILIVSGPEVTDMYVGESERKVRELFAEARNNAPAVLVFDEFDAIASKRSGDRGQDGGTRAGNALVAQILTEMDGFRPEVPLLVIGTTNRLDIIDEALLRPSRFRAIHIGLPNCDAREEIAWVHADHFHIDIKPTLLRKIAMATDGLNGDEIRSIFRDACVGIYCQNQPVDARQLGRLVGQLRRNKQAHAISTMQHNRQNRQGATGNDGMINLT